MIPNVIHFIFGLKEDFGEKPFSFIHYLAIKSAYECNKPNVIKFHYKYEPNGEWWEKSKEYLTPIRIEPPKEIFGNPLLHFAHQADVLRLDILIKEGGIYLDMDVLCLNSFTPLRKYKCVMGIEDTVGLSNAVILAEANSEFLRMWYSEYKSFRSKGKDEFYVEHSVKLPFKLAKMNPKMLHIEDKFSFCWPNYYGSPIPLWDRPPVGRRDTLLIKFKKWFVLKFISNSYCIHLWESVWWDKYLKFITLEYIKTIDNNFSKLCRNLLFSKIRVQRNNFFVLRPLMKKIIDIYLPRLTTTQ
jgi:hypothetical protein